MRRVLLEPKTWSELCSAADATCNIPFINPTGSRLYDGVWVGYADFEHEPDISLREVTVPSFRDAIAFFLLGREASCAVQTTAPSAWRASRWLRRLAVAVVLASIFFRRRYK
jgi:hypothetical protein